MTYKTLSEAIVTALAEAKKSGVAYAVQWPLGHSTVEPRKPSLRTQDMKVVECFDSGATHIA